jgi:predicted trehalose synthase
MPEAQESTTFDESAARRQLADIAGELAALRERLAGVHAALPVSPRADVMLLGEETPDFPTEARRTLECTRADHLDPLITTLRTAADYRPENERDCP